MADTNKPSVPGTEQAEQQDMLRGVNREANDRINHAAEVAAIQSEFRALTGQALTMPARWGRRGYVIPWRFGARDVPRGTPIEMPLTERDADRLVEPIVEHLFAGSRLPSVRGIGSTVRGRFRQLFAERSYQGAVPADSVSEPLVVGRALLDAVYEQIKQTDLEQLAANVASQIPDLPLPLPAGITPEYLREYYYNAGGNCLTAAGLQLLNRLRQGDVNPGKVILAFSASLDLAFVSPNTGLNLDTVMPRNGGVPRLQLQTLLGLPEGGFDQGVFRHLQNVAESYEAYAAVPNEQLVYSQPPPLGGMVRDDSAYRRALERYDAAQSYARSVQTSMLGLVRYYWPAYTIGGAVLVAPPAHPIPAALEPLLAHSPTRHTEITAFLNGIYAGAGNVVPRASQVRDIVKNAFGGTLSTSAEYKTESAKRDDERGLNGSDACNKILAEYARSVGRVDEHTAKQALATLTGRVKAAEQGLREQRAELSTVEAAFDEKDQRKSFHQQHKGAERWRDVLFSHLPGRNRIPGVRSQANDLYFRELNRVSCLGLPVAGFPMSEANSLDRLQTRYYGLWYLSSILPPDDPKHLPLTREVAAELTRLRRAIVERIMRNVSVIMARKGIDKLKKEDVEKMGLLGANIDDLPFDQIQDRLYAMLNEQKLPDALQEKVNKKIEQALRPLQKREEWSTWRKQQAIGLVSSTATGNGAWYNPFTWPVKGVKATVTGNGSYFNPLTWPMKTVKATVTGKGAWFNPVTWPMRLVKGVNSNYVQPWYHHLVHEKDTIF